MSALLGIADLRRESPDGSHSSLDRMAAVLAHRGAALETVTSDGCAIAVRRHDAAKAAGAVHRDGDKTLFGVDGVLFDAGPGSEAAFLAERFRRDGESAPDSLDGEFAIAWYDARARRLALARGPFGVRPLFYAVRDGVCFFASEVKSILEALPMRPAVNEAAVGDILSYGYVPHPETMFEGVFAVRPGSVVTVSERVSERVYWRYGFGREAATRLGMTDAPSGDRDERGRRFMELLDGAVEKRTRGGGLLGGYLSGGVDSTGVCLMLSRRPGLNAPAISIGFDEKAFDELPAACEAAAHLGLRHHTARVRAGDVTPELLNDVVVSYDAPFEDTSAIPTGAAARLAAAHVDIVLTGDAPDQLLAGSRRHAVALDMAGRSRPHARALQALGFRHLIRALRVRGGGNGLASRVTRKLYRDSLTIGDRTFEPRIAPLLVQREFLSPGFARRIEGRPPWRNITPVMERAAGRHPLEQCLHYDVHFYLQDCLLPKVERACSQAGVECRVPYLDRELTAFVSGLPLSDRIDGTSQKDILRRSLRPSFPDGFFDRGKRGFAIPRDEWLAGPLKTYVLDILTSRRCRERGYFDRGGLARVLDRYYRQGIRYYGASGGLLTALVTLELWHRSFMDME